MTSTTTTTTTMTNMEYEDSIFNATDPNQGTLMANNWYLLINKTKKKTFEVTVF